MNDETLVLYYYGDGLTAAERREIAAALERDPALAARYRALARELDAWRDPGDVPMPPGLEQRLRSSLKRAARLENAGRPSRAGTFRSGSFASWSFASWSFALGAGLAAALAAGIGIGLWMGERDAAEPQLVWQPPADTVEWSSAAFRRGLESHLRSARMNLADLDRPPGARRVALATSLLDRNKVYQQLALQNDAPDFARVLRSFDPILEQLGNEDLSPREVAELQAQLEFEFSVVLTRLARAASQETGPNKQELQL